LTFCYHPLSLPASTIVHQYDAQVFPRGLWPRRRCSCLVQRDCHHHHGGCQLLHHGLPVSNDPYLRHQDVYSHKLHGFDHHQLPVYLNPHQELHNSTSVYRDHHSLQHWIHNLLPSANHCGPEQPHLHCYSPNYPYHHQMPMHCHHDMSVD